MSKNFDFADVARRAVSSRKYATSLKCQNGNSFTLGGNKLEFLLPTAQARSFAMLNNAYLKFRVTNNDAASVSFDGSAGAASVFSRCEVQGSSGLLSSVSNWNVLYSALMDMGADPATSGNVLNPLMGTSQSPAEGFASVNTATAAFSGAAIAAGDARTVCVPLAINPFSTCDRGVYLGGSDAVRYSFTTEEALTAFVGDGSTANSEIVIDQVSLNFDTVTLSEEAFDLIVALSGGEFSILTTDWRCVAGNVPAGVSSATNIIGVSVSSAKRCLILPRNTVDITDGDAASIANRTLMNISQLQLSASGVLVPQIPIVVEPIADDGRGAMALAALLQSDEKLGDIKAGGLFNLGSAAGIELYAVNTTAARAAASNDIATTAGKFMAGIDLTTHPSGDSVMSGMNLLGTNFLAQYQMNVVTQVAATVLYCVEFHTLLSCSVNGTWRVQV